MHPEAEHNSTKIYFAPLQGFTDHVIRSTYQQHFSGVEKYFLPYIQVNNQGNLDKKYLIDSDASKNNLAVSVPQVLFKNTEECIMLCSYLEEQGYKTVNLNLGCPYPMVAKRGKGSGLIKNHSLIAACLNEVFNKTALKISIKLRLGYEHPDESIPIFGLMNDFPIQEVILHPRIGTQLYKGKAHIDLFQQRQEISRFPLIYNGDINSFKDHQTLKTKLPDTERIMLGRGLLSDLFLAEHILANENKAIDPARLKRYHDHVMLEYSSQIDPSNLLNKMQQFWIYFSQHFSNAPKSLKLIKKIRHMNEYQLTVSKIFSIYSPTIDQ